MLAEGRFFRSKANRGRDDTRRREKKHCQNKPLLHGPRGNKVEKVKKLPLAGIEENVYKIQGISPTIEEF